MLLSKLFTISTPYKRIYLSLILENEDRITLPGINTALFFLSKGDSIYIEDIKSLDKICFLDFQLIHDKSLEYNKEFEKLKELIKNNISKGKITEFKKLNKVVFADSLALNFKLLSV